MAEGILDALKDAPLADLVLRHPRDRDIANRQFHQLRQGKQAQNNRDQRQVIDQIVGAEIKPGDPHRLRVAHGRHHQTKPGNRQALQD